MTKDPKLYMTFILESVEKLERWTGSNISAAL